jgi:hypothetical protein
MAKPAKYQIDQKVWLKSGSGEGRVIERRLRSGADLKSQIRIAGLNQKLAEDWEYMVVGIGFSLDRWYDQDSLIG